MPPKVEEVIIYFTQRGASKTEAEEFFLFYDSKHWISKTGKYYKSWKSIAYKWVSAITKRKPELFDRKIR